MASSPKRARPDARFRRRASDRRVQRSLGREAGRLLIASCRSADGAGPRNRDFHDRIERDLIHSSNSGGIMRAMDRLVNHDARILRP